MSTKVITPPTLSAILPDPSLRTHLRIAADGTEDGLSAVYLSAAHAAAQHSTDRPIGDQTRELALDSFPDGEIALGAGVTAITSITYVDANGVTQTVGSTNYTLDNQDEADCWVLPAVGFTWPATQDVGNAVKVRFQAGAAVSDAVKAALLLMTAWLNENRGSEMAGDDIQPAAAKSLLNTVKVWSV